MLHREGVRRDRLGLRLRLVLLARHVALLVLQVLEVELGHRVLLLAGEGVAVWVVVLLGAGLDAWLSHLAVEAFKTVEGLGVEVHGVERVGRHRLLDADSKLSWRIGLALLADRGLQIASQIQRLALIMMQVLPIIAVFVRVRLIFPKRDHVIELRILLPPIRRRRSSHHRPIQRRLGHVVIIEVLVEVNGQKIGSLVQRVGLLHGVAVIP